VSDLRWSEGDSSSYVYAVSLYVNRLDEEEVLTVTQLRSLVAAAMKFSGIL
jgi:hypothetical protein